MLDICILCECLYCDRYQPSRTGRTLGVPSVRSFLCLLLRLSQLAGVHELVFLVRRLPWCSGVTGSAEMIIQLYVPGQVERWPWQPAEPVSLWREALPFSPAFLLWKSLTFIQSCLPVPPGSFTHSSPGTNFVFSSGEITGTLVSPQTDVCLHPFLCPN